MGKLLLVIDLAVIVLVAIAFGDVTAALYGVIAQVVSAYVTDAVLYGMDTAKVAYIISDRAQAVSDVIVRDLDCGVTVLRGEGAYSGSEKRVLMCAFKQKEIVTLKEMIFEIDKNAFIIVCNAHEVTATALRPTAKTRCKDRGFPRKGAASMADMERVRKNLEERGFQTSCFATAKEAADYLDARSTGLRWHRRRPCQFRPWAVGGAWPSTMEVMLALGGRRAAPGHAGRRVPHLGERPGGDG